VRKIASGFALAMTFENMTQKKIDSFEHAMEKLEEIVRSLEKGDISLEDSLKAFEEGVKWSRTCDKKLSDAKGKIEMLMKTGKTESFEVKE